MPNYAFLLFKKLPEASIIQYTRIIQILSIEENQSAAMKQAEGRARLNFIDCRTGGYIYTTGQTKLDEGGTVGGSHRSPPPPGSKGQRVAAEVRPTALQWRGATQCCCCTHCGMLFSTWLPQTSV